MSTIIAFGIIVAALIIAVSLSLKTSHNRPPPLDKGPEITEIAKELAEREKGFRDRSRENFPGDAWSQDDDFHNMELEWIRSAAKRNDISIGALFNAIDEDIRSKRVSNRRSSASPCKPRPFYD